MEKMVVFCKRKRKFQKRLLSLKFLPAMVALLFCLPWQQAQAQRASTQDVSPGGVNQSIVLWLKGDYSAAGTPADGDAVTTWTDRYDSGKDATTVSGSTGSVLYRKDKANGYPALDISGDAFLQGTAPFTGFAGGQVTVKPLNSWTDVMDTGALPAGTELSLDNIDFTSKSDFSLSLAEATDLRGLHPGMTNNNFRGMFSVGTEVYSGIYEKYWVYTFNSGGGRADRSYIYAFALNFRMNGTVLQAQISDGRYLQGHLTPAPAWTARVSDISDSFFSSDSSWKTFSLVEAQNLNILAPPQSAYDFSVFSVFKRYDESKTMIPYIIRSTANNYSDYANNAAGRGAIGLQVDGGEQRYLTFFGTNNESGGGNSVVGYLSNDINSDTEKWDRWVLSFQENYGLDRGVWTGTTKFYYPEHSGNNFVHNGARELANINEGSANLMDEYRIGNRPEITNDNAMYFAEMIAYGANSLSNLDASGTNTYTYDRVASYLALKYAITMPDMDYRDSANDIVWEADSNFNTAIMGLGRDDLSELNLRSASNGSFYGSESARLVVGTPVTVAELTNTASWGNIPSDKVFFVLGQRISSNGVVTNTIVNETTWKYKKTGSWGSTKITFAIVNNDLGGGAANRALDPDNLAKNFYIEVSGVDGNAYYKKVDPVGRDGSYLFFQLDPNDYPSTGELKFIRLVPAPGGVSKSLDLWLKASYVNLGDTSAMKTGDPISQWTDRYYASRDANVVEAGVRDYPTYRADAINGFPAVDFTGSAGMDGVVALTGAQVGINPGTGYSDFLDTASLGNDPSISIVKAQQGSTSSPFSSGNGGVLTLGTVDNSRGFFVGNTTPIVGDIVFRYWMYLRAQTGWFAGCAIEFRMNGTVLQVRERSVGVTYIMNNALTNRSDGYFNGGSFYSNYGTASINNVTIAYGAKGANYSFATFSVFKRNDENKDVVPYIIRSSTNNAAQYTGDGFSGGALGLQLGAGEGNSITHLGTFNNASSDNYAIAYLGNDSALTNEKWDRWVLSFQENNDSTSTSKFILYYPGRDKTEYSYTHAEILNLSGSVNAINEYILGYRPSSDPSYDTDMSLAEMIVFSDAVSTRDKDYDKVASYLALKYSITLPDSDYLDSEGDTLWTADSDYSKAIFGIGKDSTSEFELRGNSDEEFNGNEVLNVAIGDIKTEADLKNKTKWGSVLNDRDFFMVARKTDAESPTTDFGKETIAGTANELLSNGEWKYQTSGSWADTGAYSGGVPITLAFEIPGFETAFEEGKLYLVVSEDNTFDSSDRKVLPVAYENGRLFFQINPHTYSKTGYFRIMKKTPAPGAILSNIKLWLKADAFTSTTEDGESVRTWSDKYDSTSDAHAAGNGVLYKTNVANGYPALNFSGQATMSGSFQLFGGISFASLSTAWQDVETVSPGDSYSLGKVTIFNRSTAGSSYAPEATVSEASTNNLNGVFVEDATPVAGGLAAMYVVYSVQVQRTIYNPYWATLEFRMNGNVLQARYGTTNSRSGSSFAGLSSRAGQVTAANRSLSWFRNSGFSYNQVALGNLQLVQGGGGGGGSDVNFTIMSVFKRYDSSKTIYPYIMRSTDNNYSDYANDAEAQGAIGLQLTGGDQNSIRHYGTFNDNSGNNYADANLAGDANSKPVDWNRWVMTIQGNDSGASVNWQASLNYFYPGFVKTEYTYNAKEEIMDLPGTGAINGVNEYLIGFRPELGSTDEAMYMAEMIAYSSSKETLDADISNAENRVASYLALKYAITMPSTDYRDSADNLLWEADTNYNNAIIGVGYDEASELDLKSSSDENFYGKESRRVIIGKPLTKADLASRTNFESAPQDNNFFVMGSSSSIPEIEFSGDVLGGAPLNYLSAGTWKYEKAGSWTGDDGKQATITIAFTLYNRDRIEVNKMVISSDEVYNIQNDSVVTLAGQDSNVLFFQVNAAKIPNKGYIRLIKVTPAPGGVYSYIRLWLKSDYFDKSLIDPEMVSSIQTWTNRYSAAEDGNQADANLRPIYHSPDSDLSLNGYPTLQFQSDYLMGDVFFPDWSDTTTKRDGELSAYVVSKRVATGSSGGLFEFLLPNKQRSDSKGDAIGIGWKSTAKDSYQIFGSPDGAVDNVSYRDFVYNVENKQSHDVYVILKYGLNHTDGVGASSGYTQKTSFYVSEAMPMEDLVSNQSNLMDSASPEAPTKYFIGANSDGDNANAGSVLANLSVAEFIMYGSGETELESVNTNAEDRILSYLALKYAMTIPNLDYVDAENNTIWAKSAIFSHTIIGVGRDDLSELDLRMSSDGQYGKQEALRIAIGTPTTISEIESHTLLGKASQDRDFIVVGGKAEDPQFTFDQELGIDNVKLFADAKNYFKIQKTGLWTQVNSSKGLTITIALNKSFKRDTSASINAETSILLSTDTVFTASDTRYTLTAQDSQYFYYQINANDLLDVNYLCLISPVVDATPGGVKNYLNLWLDSDYLQTASSLVEGDNVAAWTDRFSGLAKAQGTLGTQPVFHSATSTDTTMNGHPVVEFTNDVLSGELGLPEWAESGNARQREVSIYSVYRLKESGSNGVYLLLSDNKAQADRTSGTIGLAEGASASDISVLGWATSGSNFKTLKSSSIDLSGDWVISSLSAEEENGVSSGALSIYAVNGGAFKQNLSGTLYNDANASELNRYYLGARSSGTTPDADNMNKDMDLVEFIVYGSGDTELEALEPKHEKRILSYLAIKYGITLNDFDYVDSKTSTIWTKTTDFTTAIMGVGKDGAGAIDQRIALGTDRGDVFNFAIGETYTLDSSLLEAMPEDRSFVMLANDNGATSYNYEMSGKYWIKRAPKFQGMKRMWKVVPTLSENVTLTFALQISETITEIMPQFVVSTDKDFTKNVSLYDGVRDDNYVYYRVSIPTQTAYIRIGYQELDFVPGGVRDNLVTWLDAGRVNVIQTLPDNASRLKKWLTVNVSPASLTQNTESLAPLWYSKDSSENVNGNAVVSFDGGAFLSGTFWKLNQPLSAYVVYKQKTMSPGAQYVLWTAKDEATAKRGDLFGLLVSPSALMYSLPNSGQGMVNANVASNRWVIAKLSYSSSTASVTAAYSDGELDSRMNVGMGSTASTYRLGGGVDGTMATGHFNGKIAELAIYRNDFQAKTDTKNRDERIKSYLSIKYGVGIPGMNYYDSASNLIWESDSGFDNQVAGIGKDEKSGLNQVMSRQADNLDMLRISNGTVQTDTLSLIAPIKEDKSFVLWANDGGTQSLTILDKTIGRFLLPRTWKVQRIGTGIKSITVGLSLNTFSKDEIAGQRTMFVFTDSPTTNLLKAVALTSSDTAYYYFTYEYPNVTKPLYLRFGINDNENPAPGGVGVSLAMWLKAETVKGGSTKTMTLSLWGDNTTKSNGASTTLSTQIPLWTTSLATSSLSDEGINYHPYVSFSGGRKYNVTPLDSYLLQSKINVFMVYRSMRKASYSGQDIASAEAFDYKSTSKIAWTSSLLQGPEMKYKEVSDNNFADVLNSVGSDWSLGVVFSGTDREGLSNYFADKEIAEIAVYNRTLTTEELSKVYSYFSMKYGLNYNEVYEDASGLPISLNTGIEKGGVTTYTHNIFALGRDDASALYIKQAYSSKQKDVMAVSLGEIATTNEKNKSTISKDSSFLIISDDSKALSLSPSGLPDNILNDPQYCVSRVGRTWQLQKSISSTNSTSPLSQSNLYIYLNKNSFDKAATNTYTSYFVIIDKDGDGNFKTGNVTKYEKTGIKSDVIEFKIPSSAIDADGDGKDVITFYRRDGYPTKPTITLMPTATVCYLNTITIVASGQDLYEYHWYKGDVSSISNRVQLTTNTSIDTLTLVTPSDSGLYELAVVGAGGCSITMDLYSVTIYQFNSPQLQLSKSEFCLGETITINNLYVDDQAEYYWYKDDKGLDNMDSSSLGGVTEDGIYRIDAVVTGVCTTSSEVKVEFDKVGNYDFSRDIYYIIGNSLTTTVIPVDVTLQGSPTTGVSFAWYFEGNTIAGADTMTVNIAEEGLVKVVVTNVRQCSREYEVAVQSLTIDCDNILTYTLSGLVTEVCDGDSIRMKAKQDTMNHVWYKDGVAIANQASEVFYAKENGVYYVQSIIILSANKACYIASIPETLTFRDLPEVYAIGRTATTDPNFCEGSSARLLATGKETYDYSWYKAGQEIANSTNSVVVSEVGMYTVVAVDTFGCKNVSDAYSNTFNLLPETPEFDKTGAQLVCKGDKVSLSISNYNSISQSNLRNNKISKTIWYKDGAEVSAAGNTTSYQFSEGGGVYGVALENAQGCLSEKAEIEFTEVNPGDAGVKISYDRTILCSDGDVVALTAPQNATYAWYREDSGTTTNTVLLSNTTNILPITQEGVYFAQITLSSVCKVNSEKVTVESIPFAPKDIVIPQISRNNEAYFYRSAGSISLTVEPLSKKDTLTKVTWYDIEGNVISNGNLLTVYTDKQVSVEVSNQNRCTTSKALTVVRVNEPADSVLITSNKTPKLLLGQEIVLYANPIPSAQPYYTYQWLVDGGLVDNAIEDIYTVKNSKSGAYQVSVFDGVKTVTSDPFYVEFSIPAPPLGYIETPVNDCINHTKTLICKDTNADKYYWYLGGVKFAETVSNQIDVLDGGDYQVATYNAKYDVISEKSKKLEILDLFKTAPKIIFNKGSRYVLRGTQIVLGISSIGDVANDLDISWTSSDPSFVPSTKSQITAYPALDKVTYSLEISVDGLPCSYQDSVQVNILPEQEIVTFGDIITAEHPQIEINNIEYFPQNLFLVYDITGTLLFQVQGVGTAWDGRDNDGNLLPTGIYFVVINYTDHGVQKTQSSIVNIIRRRGDK